ncbi:kinase-like domain-containing protein [Annulohypoxylon maeteangense]|uniref:kinase-like domain-containing protein n=1 Tax=Annulohypoxylon maeteangense TaxID=1927788 RepID=UPI00200842BE|nr:kinase-like domain-containing protein [Annulohypoxylon maeteangense]KAI0880254.1 kinase-like domain-containing protein [Annulohypoxylon maeteangense]
MASLPYPAPPGANGVLGSTEPLPMTPQEITAEWCTKILNHKVKRITIVKEIHSTASSILIDLTYEGNHNSDEVPTHICIKGGFNKPLIELHPNLLWTYRREAEFYFYIGPIVEMNLPKIWYCGTDVVAGQGLVVMDNLAAQDRSFGEPSQPWPVARVRAAVEQLAILHAKTWGAKEENFPWMAADKEMGGNPLQAMVSSLLTAEAWDARFKDAPAPPLPEAIADRESFERVFKIMWATENPKLRCVVHGDSHIGNTFITADGQPGFIDWQGSYAGVNVQDLAYFLIGVLTIEERRKHEVDIIQHYLQALHQNGGPKFEKDDIWHDYRKHALHGVGWALAAPGMQSDENVFIMVERHVAAVSDHGTIELLESLPEYRF